nr:hypothetical protein CFP56_00395 [Quercus suber]
MLPPKTTTCEHEHSVWVSNDVRYTSSKTLPVTQAMLDSVFGGWEIADSRKGFLCRGQSCALSRWARSRVNEDGWRSRAQDIQSRPLKSNTRPICRGRSLTSIHLVRCSRESRDQEMSPRGHPDSRLRSPSSIGNVSTPVGRLQQEMRRHDEIGSGLPAQDVQPAGSRSSTPTWRTEVRKQSLDHAREEYSFYVPTALA